MRRRNRKNFAPIENLEIVGISSDGRSVGRKDGIVVFVQGGAPGDIVDVDIIGKEKKLLVGRITRFHQQSADRQEPFCQHFGTCGGCKWQHISYEAQLRHKESHVLENLRKLSGLELPVAHPIMGSPSSTYYRNKLEFTFSDNRWLTKEEIAEGTELSRNALGFHIPRMFDKILNIEECFLQNDLSNQIRNRLKSFADENGVSFYNLKEQHGILRNLIIRNTTLDETMVIVQFGEEDSEQINLVMEFLEETFPQINSLMYIINTKGNETYYDLPVHLQKGKPYIHEMMGKLKFRIGPKSFFQTNSVQAMALYDRVVDMAQLTGNELVYDLYTGTGTIANYVAVIARKVIGIESVPEAIEDAKINSDINQITNTAFFAGDMKDLLSRDFIARHGRPDVVITDPPRAGMHGKVIEMLLEVKAQRIVYVSCNPATQARDLQLLGEAYVVEQIQPVDMFPQTHHVENIVSLRLKD